MLRRTVVARMATTPLMQACGVPAPDTDTNPRAPPRRPHRALDALAAHIDQDTARTACFRRHYNGKFKDMAEDHHRAVLFFTPECLESCEKRQVPIKYDPSLFAGGRDVDWSKLVVVNGPTGSGKTCFGLFGLTKPHQLLVYVASQPPPKAQKYMYDVPGLTRRVEAMVRWASDLRKDLTFWQDIDGPDDDEVPRPVEETLVEDMIDPATRADAKDARSDCLEAALRLHILDKLEERIGMRRDVGDDETVEVIFFFEFSRNDREGRRGWEVLELVERGMNSEFAAALRADFGLTLCGMAVESHDLPVPIGSPNYLTPRAECLDWSKLTDRPFDADEAVAGDVQKVLDAALGLPRLAALALDAASGTDSGCAGGALTKGALRDCVLASVKEFARTAPFRDLSRQTVVWVNPDPKHRPEELRMIVLKCVRVMLFPSTLDGEIHSPSRTSTVGNKVADFGFLGFTKREGRNAFDTTIGPAQQLVLGHYFEMPPPTSFPSFLKRAAHASRGKTLAEFAAALNAFFSHRAQFKSSSNPSADVLHFEAVTAMKAPVGLESHVLGGGPPNYYGVETEPDNRVSTRIDGDDVDLQLVVPVTAPGGGAPHDLVSFNFRYFVPSLEECRSESNFLKHRYTARQRAAADGKALQAPPVASGVHHHGGFIPVFGLRHGPCWMGNGWHVNLTHDQREPPMLRRSVSKLTGAFKCPQLDALAAHINKDPARAVCFHRHYTGKFKDMAAEDDRAVLFFTPKCVESCEKRQVPIKYDPSLFAGGRDVDWSKLVVVNGPTGSGKTCFGLFGLTKPEQLLVYVSVPPRIDKLKVSDVSPRVGEWISCAEQNQRLYDSGDMLENHSLSYYDAALRHYVLDCLEARIGKRVNVHDDDTVEVVFFFDKFYSGSDVVQHGVRDIAATWREKGVLCELSKTLRDDYGLELSGVAVVGAGLDLNALAQSPNLLTPRTDQLSWCQLTSHPFEKDEQVPLHVQAELDAAVQLPRLAALILQRATARCGEDQPLTMTALYEGLLIAVRAFARLSALSGLARNEAKRHEVGRLCLRMLLLARDYPMPSCDTATDEVRDDDTHAVVVRYGLAVLTPPKRNVPSRSMYRDIAFGPAQRLLLRHFFGVSKHSPTGTATHAADFKLALAEFLCRAAAAFCGITVDKLLSSLKEFFSPPVQTRFKSNYWAPRIDEIPKEWPGYFIRADTGAVVHLHKRAADSQLEVPPRQVTVLVNTADSDLPWDLQLVLPVTRKEDGTEVEFATINVNTTQCLSMPPSEMVQFKHEQVKIQANAPAVVRGAHRRCGFIPVFGRPNALCWGWQVDVADPGSLVVVPFRAWSPSETGSSVPASAPGGVTPM